MLTESNSRRGFLKVVAAFLGGIGAVSLMAAPAQAGRSRWRGGYGGFGGYVPYRSGRRFYGGGYGGYVPYRRSGRRVYGGYAPPVYGQPYYGPPIVPVVPVQPYYPGYYGPVMKRDAVRAIDALSLLEA